ncbi:MAG TPA: methyltransferase domain-containing protein [Ghiorsea sp.]|nr:methyltransferase domain-containing protein [Ghiorsea sp.]HIP07067.1 methyltransferase domain-containing protein [Mariprofundaceae bacterium]
MIAGLVLQLMEDPTLTSAKETFNHPPHRALYHAVSKQLWSVFQKRVFQFWSNERALKSRQVFSKRYYLPLIKPYVSSFSEDLKVLEIGSGPVCAAQYLEKGHHVYVDPLIDDYRKLFPGVMPEKAEYISIMAEKIELQSSSFNLVLCLDTLSDVHNPELVMHKVHDVLEQDGCFIVSMDIWPLWLAWLHYFLFRVVPVLPQFNRLYSYTHKGFRNTLLRHFEIQEEHLVSPSFSWLLFKKEVLFVCKHKHD